MKIPSTLRLPLRMLIFATVAFAACRLLLLVLHPEYFGDLSATSFMLAFLHGVRFDLALTVVCLLPALLIAILPLQAVQHPRVLRPLAWVSWLMLAALIVLYLSDIAYFGEVKRHIGRDLLQLDADLGAVIEIALFSRTLTTAGGLLLIGALSVLWWRLVVRPIASTPAMTARLPARLGMLLLALFALVWLGRGMVVSGKPIDVIDAFAAGNERRANLALNGAFVTLHEARREGRKPLRLVDGKLFEEMAAEHGDRPFAWRNERSFEHRPNVVLILLESWSYRYIDALGGNGYGVTPNFDRIVAQSQVWDRFYAAGQRSITGIQAALTSLPALNSQPLLGYGLELNRINRIADIVEGEGYATLMMQSSNRRSFHLDGIASSLGFDRYYGKEDMPLRRHYPQDVPRFGWDYEAFMFLADQLSSQPAEHPFFAFLFTGTTHEPFADPGAKFHIRPHDPRSENGFLNTLHYSDWALGEFMRQAASKAWFKDTVFVFTADHTLNSEGLDLAADYHIPLVI